MNDDERWFEIAGLILDGQTVAWDAVPAGRPGDTASADALRVIADVASLHRAGEPLRRWGTLSIQEQIGHGTFGDVYRARDTTLDRDVALKLVDHASSATAPDEGRLLARVRHSNVVMVHGAAIHDGRYGIWMEYIRGRTLADIVRKDGPLEEDDVRAIGIDVCRALTAVHESGLLHGDIKPHNVMREEGGRIVVMDFGTGRVVKGSVAGPSLVGTPLYLAPEVLSGAASDVRADIYAAGVLLYCLLTGAHPVEGKTLDEIRAAHRSGARMPLRSRRPVPRPLADIIERAIAIEPIDRFETAAEFERALRDQSTKRSRAIGHRLAAVLSEVDSGRHPRQPTTPTRHIRLLVSGALIVSVGLGIAYYTRPRPAEVSLTGEWHINPPPDTTLLTGGVLSPDGRAIAFVTIDEWGTTGLWVQTLGSLDQLRLPGTEHARAPFWSPDGKGVLFAADGKLKRIGLTDKAPQTLANVSLAPFKDHGGTSSSTDVLFSPMERGPLCRLKEDGTFVPVTRLGPGERVHLWPSFLPDGRHFLYRAAALGDNRAGTYVGSLDSLDQRTRLEGVTSAAVYASGYLVFVREGALVAQRFDAGRRQLEGVPVVVARNVAAPHEQLGLTFSASGEGISYLAGGVSDQLAWFDRRGLFLGALDRSAGWSEPALSPDDREVLADRPTADVGFQPWIVATSSGTPSRRLETGQPQGSLAVWSHDGQRIAFTFAGDLYWVPADGGQAHLLIQAPTGEQPLRLQDWSRDGRFLLYYTPNPKTRADLWWFSTVDHKAEPFLQSSANEAQGQLSPDGHWLAYMTDETGQTEVYVQRFPESGSRQKISVSGGAQPQWRRDGRELFYLSLENHLMSVEVHPGAPPRFGQPQKLFHIALNRSLTDVRNSYAVSRDGSRFLFSARPSNLPPIAVRLNWTAVLQQ